MSLVPVETSRSGERGQAIQALLHYARYNCGIYLTTHVKIMIDTITNDVKYLARNYIPKETRILYMPSSCRITFQLFFQELPILWNDWMNLMRLLIESFRSQQQPQEIKSITIDKIIYTIGMIGIICKCYHEHNLPTSSLMLQYCSYYWNAIQSIFPSEDEVMIGWKKSDLVDLSSSTYFNDDVLPSLTNGLHEIYEQICFPFFQRFRALFTFPATSLFSLEDGLPTFYTFRSLFFLVSSRTFATNQFSQCFSNPSEYAPLMILPIIDFLNGTYFEGTENCSLELFQDDNPTDSTISSINGMYNVITVRDILAGEEILIQYLSPSSTGIADYLQNYGILPYQVPLNATNFNYDPHGGVAFISIIPDSILRYLTWKISPADREEFAASLLGIFPSCKPFRLSIPLISSQKKVLNALSSFLCQRIHSDNESLGRFNCLAEVLSPINDSIIIEPSHSLSHYISSLYHKWLEVRDTHDSISNRLHSALLIYVFEHRIRLVIMSYLKELTETIGRSQYEITMTDVINEIEQNLTSFHAIYLSSTLKDVCCWCGKNRADVGTLSQCSRCRGVMYCSQTCQKAHWKKHQQVCQTHG